MTIAEKVEKAQRMPTDEELHISPIEVTHTDSGVELYNQRSYNVVKSNEIIQHARDELSIAQLKAFAYALSKVKPDDKKEQWYEFSISDYCSVFGIDGDNGGNYSYVKKIFKSLRDTSFWLINENGHETTVGYLDKVDTHKGSGKVRFRFDEDLSKYILGLMNNFTQYSLFYTLPMRSAYSFKLYELLRSYAFTERHEFAIDEFKKLLNCSQYTNFKDVRVRVIETALKEINLYTDIEVTWEQKCQGKKVVAVIFNIAQRNTWDKAVAEKRVMDELGFKKDPNKKPEKKSKEQTEGQISLYDMETKDA